jgi:hypothetical protein
MANERIKKFFTFSLDTIQLNIQYTSRMKKTLLHIGKKAYISIIFGLLSFNFEANATVNSQEVFRLAQRTNAREAEEVLGSVHKNTLMSLLRARNANGEAPLEVAAQNGQISFMRLVIRRIDNPNRLLKLLPPAMNRAVLFEDDKFVKAIVNGVKRDPNLLFELLKTEENNGIIFHSLLGKVSRKKFQDSLEIIFKSFSENPELLLRLLEITDDRIHNSFWAANSRFVKDQLIAKRNQLTKELSR